MTTSEEIAWAAGFFEGEGCFTEHRGHARKDGSYTVHMRASMEQRDEPLLLRFKEIVGEEGSTYEHGSRPGLFVWITVRHGEAERVYHLLKDWLSPRRVARAEYLLAREGLRIWPNCGTPQPNEH